MTPMGERRRRKRERAADEGASPRPGAEQGGPVLEGKVAFGRRRLTFHLDNADDVVQRPLSKGRFYEAELLSEHRDLIYRKSTVLDVGANVGNHTVFYALSGAARVYPFEPNPRPQQLLRRTVAGNDLSNVDLSHVALGVGSSPGSLFLSTPSENNLGATRLQATGQHEVQVRPLDDLKFKGPISLLKIDVEGMEMDVLAGAERLIAEHRPGLGIEVDDQHLDAFWGWLETYHYHVTKAVKRNGRCVNYLCVPKGAGRAGPVSPEQ